MSSILRGAVFDPPFTLTFKRVGEAANKGVGEAANNIMCALTQWFRIYRCTTSILLFHCGRVLCDKLDTLAIVRPVHRALKF